MSWKLKRRNNKVRIAWTQVRLELRAHLVAEGLLARPARHDAPVAADCRQLAGVLPEADVPRFHHEERRALLHDVPLDLPPYGRWFHADKTKPLICYIGGAFKTGLSDFVFCLRDDP